MFNTKGRHYYQVLLCVGSANLRQGNWILLDSENGMGLAGGAHPVCCWTNIRPLDAKERKANKRPLLIEPAECLQTTA